jgi:hypothetical protein
MMRNTVFLVVLFFLSCTKSGENEDFSRNRALWEKKNLSNYEFTLTVSCFCPEDVTEPHLLKVVDDTIASVNDIPYNPSTMGLLMTIDELFTYVGNSIESKPYQKSITYNSLYGYPESVYFDFEKTMADEEIGYRITGFKKN